MKDWLSFVATEEMDSKNQALLIAYAVKYIKDIIGTPDKVLCVGVGDGTEMDYFSNPIGIDISDKSITQCKKDGLDVLKMDMHHMTFKDNLFDLVFSKDNFEHAISPIEAISEFARVSSKYVAIIVPDEKWQSSGWHFIIPTIKQMVSLGEKVGLALKALREYEVVVGQFSVTQSLYVFQKL